MRTVLLPDKRSLAQLGGLIKHLLYLMKRICTLICFSIVVSRLLTAADWPEYRGPNGDGTCTETPNLNWAASGPKVLWKAPIKNGFSSFTIADGKAFTQMN